jgi:formiminotetrahydrofolate cyclodeaminase
MLDSKPEMDIIGIEAQLLKDQLAFLVDEDTEAFNQVMSANRLPSSNENEKIKKSQSVELANQYAIDVPMETAELCFKVLKLANQLVDNGNPNSVSDAGVAGELALAGVRGACMNVLINLPSVDDLKYKNEKKEAVEKLKKDAEQLHAIIHQQTNEKIEE